jgi:hypothetical protein
MCRSRVDWAEVCSRSKWFEICPQRRSLAYINPRIFSDDNGRVLGYDNSHSFSHRHFMGKMTPEPFPGYEALYDRFDAEWTPKRFELLRLAFKRRRSIGDLATASQRDRSAVSRDVAKLQKLGLVKVELVANPGHGQMKIVTPVATRIAIDASLESA